jgi:hypothetical protein
MSYPHDAPFDQFDHPTHVEDMIIGEVEAHLGFGEQAMQVHHLDWTQFPRAGQGSLDFRV